MSFKKLIVIALVLTNLAASKDREFSPMDDSLFGEEYDSLKSRGAFGAGAAWVSNPFFDKRWVGCYHLTYRRYRDMYQIFPWLKSLFTDLQINLITSRITKKDYQVIFFNPLSADFGIAFGWFKLKNTDFNPFLKIGVGYNALSIRNDQVAGEKTKFEQVLYPRITLGAEYFYVAARASVTFDVLWYMFRQEEDLVYKNRHFVGIGISMYYYVINKDSFDK